MIVALDGDLVFIEDEKKGPGKGWWGPPRGTHGREDVAPKEKDVKISYGRGLLDEEKVTEKTGLALSDYREMFHLSGYTAEVEFDVTRTGEVETNVFWYKEGVAAGSAHRIFDGKVAKNDVFELDEKNKGFGRTLYKQQIGVLTRAGYEEIQLFADITIGRYAWAKMGFDYRNPGEAARVTKRFQEWAGKRNIESPEGGWPKFKSALDVATYKISGVFMVGKDITNRDVPSDMRMDIGKAFMLDKARVEGGHGSWGGVLRLAPREVGRGS